MTEMLLAKAEQMSDDGGAPLDYAYTGQDGGGGPYGMELVARASRGSATRSGQWRWWRNGSAAARAV